MAEEGGSLHDEEFAKIADANQDVAKSGERGARDLVRDQGLAAQAEFAAADRDARTPDHPIAPRQGGARDFLLGLADRLRKKS